MTVTVQMFTKLDLERQFFNMAPL